MRSFWRAIRPDGLARWLSSCQRLGQLRGPRHHRDQGWFKLRVKLIERQTFSTCWLRAQDFPDGGNNKKKVSVLKCKDLGARVPSTPPSFRGVLSIQGLLGDAVPTLWADPPDENDLRDEVVEGSVREALWPSNFFTELISGHSKT